MSKTNGKRNKAAGGNWERELAKIFREIGFKHVVTTRAESRTRDAQKIDLINKDEFKNGRLPYNVQAKNVKGHLRYGKILGEMPTVAGIINVVLHKQTERVNDRFISKDKFAILRLDDFLKLIQQRDESKPTGRVVVQEDGRGDEETILPRTNEPTKRRVHDVQDIPLPDKYL